MSRAEAVAELIRRLRPNAKFIAVEHSSEFIGAEAELGEGFYTANLYDERIDANMVAFKQGPVMIQNTYVSSFAFNLFLSWLYAARSVPTDEAPGVLDRLLAINFKKFFAEQVYRRTNRVPSRALLIESLIFESDLMRPVFERKTVDSELSDDADAGERLMSLLLSMHELGHFYASINSNFWGGILAEHPNTIGAVYRQAAETAVPKVLSEFLCDAFAVVYCVNQLADSKGPLFALRAAVFSFASYATMYSAAASADATGAAWERTYDDVIDFRNIAAMPHIDHDVIWKHDPAFLERARLVIELCQKMAEERGVSLFGMDPPFPLPAAILNDMVMYVTRVFDVDGDTPRRMSNLLAQAFTDHEKGVEYLYLRSKVFRTNRPEPLQA